MQAASAGRSASEEKILGPIVEAGSDVIMRRRDPGTACNEWFAGPGQQPMSNKRKILIIEDEAAQVLLVRSRLEEAGFDVLSAMNGEDGLRKAKHERPDLILLDIVLPGMDGVQVCDQLKQDPATQRIPVIMLTASGMRNLEERCKVFGADACLVKPYRPSELLEKIGTVLPQTNSSSKPIL